MFSHFLRININANVEDFKIVFKIENFCYNKTEHKVRFHIKLSPKVNAKCGNEYAHCRFDESSMILPLLEYDWHSSAYK